MTAGSPDRNDAASNMDARDLQMREYAKDIALLYRQEKRARQELEERHRDLEVLIEMHGRLARCLDADSLLDLLLDVFVAHFRIPRALVYLTAPEAERFSFVQGRAVEPLKLPTRPPSISAGHPLYQHLIAESQDFLLLRREDPDIVGWLEATYDKDGRPKDVLCLPLPGRTQVQGFVAVDAGDIEGGMDAAQRPVLTLMARQAGILLENALLYERSQTELSTVRTLLDEEQQKLIGRHQFDSLIGASAQMQSIFNLLRTVADVDVPVFVLGETGTGKELVARSLHFTSRRKDRPFVSVNCASLPSELVESELFGHEKGSFTGAFQRRIGKVEMAEGGTLFLDEIGEMPANLQAKLLRFLEDQTFERIGGDRPLQANVRIVAATNRDVEAAIKENKLRMDLVYRLNTITVRLPPLRERLDDVPLLVSRFVQQANEQYGCAITGVDPKVYPILMKHRWPGNIRELKNVIDRAAILAQSETITPQSIQLASTELAEGGDESLTPPIPYDYRRSLTELKQDVVEQFERTYMDRLLKQSGGNISQAARLAHIDKKNFLEKMRRYQIKRDDYL